MLSLNDERVAKRTARPSLALIQLASLVSVLLSCGSIAAFVLSILLGGNLRLALDACGGFLLTGITTLMYWNWVTPVAQRRIGHLHDHALPWCGAACSLGLVIIIRAGTRSLHEFGIELIGASLLFWLSITAIKLLR